MMMNVMICPTDLVEKTSSLFNKAHEKTFTTNKYLLYVVLGRQDNEGKVSLAHEDLKDNSLQSFEESYRTGLLKHNTPIKQSYIP